MPHVLTRVTPWPVSLSLPPFYKGGLVLSLYLNYLLKGSVSISLFILRVCDSASIFVSKFICIIFYFLKFRI